MKAIRLVCLLAIAALGIAASAGALQAQGGYGRVSGRVVQAGSGEALTGAQVVVGGTSIGAVTDENGRYFLPRVPAGSQTIEVTYLGRSTATQTVTVADGQLATADFVLETLAIAQPELVVGIRASGQAEALSRQKAAPNIQNIVASDQMGRFPDASAPEAIQRVPGVALERDQGEGRYIQIRGGSAANTQVTVNGEQAPSPEAEIRQIELDAVPVEVLEAIEVSKAITPDMDAEAIGGSVNLVTKQAPEDMLFSIEGSGGYAPIRDDPSGSGSITWGSRTSDGRLGFLASGSFSRRNFGSDDLEPAYDIGDPGPDDDEIEEVAVRHYSMYRDRFGATASLDYRLGEGSNLFLNGLYSQLNDNEQRLELLNSVEDEALEFSHRNRYEKTSNLNVSAGGEHLIGSGMELEYRGTVARGRQETPNDYELIFVREDVEFETDISDPDDIRADPVGGAGGTYLFDAFEPASDETTNLDLVGAVDLTIPYTFGSEGAGNFKVGFKIRDKDKDQSVNEEAFELIDDAADIVLGEDIGEPFTLEDYNPGDYEFVPFVTTEDENEAFLDRFGDVLEGGLDLEAETQDFEVGETTTAVYAMTEINLTPRFMVLPGVRFEHTNVTSDGFDFNAEEETLTPVSAENDYGRLFPMLHLKYELGPLTNLRAAVTTAIARPNFVDLVPFRVVDEEDIVIGNPDLDPTTSTNLDLLFEHYDSRIGVMSAGVFYKSLNDPIFPFTEENELGGETVQPRNIDSGEIKGVEFALQQQLTWLPAPLDGLGIYGNYTFTDSDATLPGGRETRLGGQSKNVANAALSYERAGFSAQVSMNYRDDFILEFGGDTGDTEERESDLIVDDHLQFDLSASYQATTQATIFLELVNLNNEPFVTYQGIPERPIQEEFYETWGEIGVRWRM
ncbi:MAG TPA: TonB-dependent receptor [Gemmatimonadota bacterium]|jgi:TonB-dependent receptor|nr:TonB-dependent receptor [Gemmatimonadota bacterium]